VKLSGGVTGLGGVNAALSDIASGNALEKALADTAEEIRRRAAATLTDGAAPDSRTGALADSLTVARDDGGGGYMVSTPLDHGWHIEFGSSLRPAMPWLTPSADEAQPGLAERVSESMNASIAGAVRRTR
jgi:hypothetical protein